MGYFRESQANLSYRFAWVKDKDRFLEGDCTTAVTGAPVLANALAWLDCTIFGRYPIGTHTIYVGEVQGRTERLAAITTTLKHL